MTMIEILNTCNDAAISNIVNIIKNIFLIIEIVVPIMLVVWGTYAFLQLMKDPDMKNGMKIVFNKYIAAIIVFLIPVIINAFMYMLGNNSSFSSCWNTSTSKFGINSTFITPKDSKKNIVGSSSSDYEKGEKRKDNTKSVTGSNGDSLPNNPPKVVATSPYGEALAAEALNLACSAIGTDYLTAADAAKVGCTLSGDGRLHVPNVEHSHRYRAVLPQTANIINFWDEEKKRNLGGIGWYGPASCSPWIGSLLRVMGYDKNISTKAAIDEAPVSPWTGERITNCNSAHGIGTYMYNHPESFDNLAVNSNASIASQCLPGDIIAGPSHILIYVGNDLARKAFPGTTGNAVEAAELGRNYPGVTAAGNGNIGSYKAFRVRKPATGKP